MLYQSKIFICSKDTNNITSFLGCFCGESVFIFTFMEVSLEKSHTDIIYCFKVIVVVHIAMHFISSAQEVLNCLCFIEDLFVITF